MITRSLLALFLIAPALCAQDMPLSQIVIPGEGWKRIPGRFAPVAALTPAGAAGQLLVWDANNRPQALLDVDTRVVREGLPETTLSQGTVVVGERAYTIGPDRKSLVGAAVGGDKFLDAKLEVAEAGAIAASPDGGSLLVADAGGKHVWVYRLDRDGRLSGGDKYITLRTLPYWPSTLKEKAPTEPKSGASAITWDQAGRIYVATRAGVQVFDPTGRLCGVLEQPAKFGVTGMAFGGLSGDLLFIACGDELYYRRLNARSGFANVR